MTYTIIAVCIISGLAGIKKPIYGGLSGLILAPLLHCFFYDFDLFIFAILFPVGFVIGLFLGGTVNRLFRFIVGDLGDDKYKPHYGSMHHGSGGAWGGGIVYTDEERKNAKQNENRG